MARKGKGYKSSETGRFVNEETAAENPASTYLDTWEKGAKGPNENGYLLTANPEKEVDLSEIREQLILAERGKQLPPETPAYVDIDLYINHVRYLLDRIDTTINNVNY